MKQKEKLQMQRQLRGSVWCRSARTLFWHVWSLMRSEEWVGVLQTMLGTGSVVHLPGMSPFFFSTSLFIIHTDLYHNISRKILLLLLF